MNPTLRMITFKNDRSMIATISGRQSRETRDYCTVFACLLVTRARQYSSVIKINVVPSSARASTRSELLAYTRHRCRWQIAAAATWRRPRRARHRERSRAWTALPSQALLARQSRDASSCELRPTFNVGRRLVKQQYIDNRSRSSNENEWCSIARIDVAGRVLDRSIVGESQG